jgi:hypothetical protein
VLKKISNTKCTYYVNTWSYTTTGHPQINQGEPDNITLHATHETIIIKGISPQDKHRTLGYHQSTAKQKIHQHQLFTKKIERNVCIMKRTELTYAEFNTYYTSTFVLRIIYTAALSTVTSSQTKKLMEKMIQPTLRKKGFHGSTPLGIALGLRKLGGLQLLDVYAHQGALKAIQVIKLHTSKQQSGKLFRITYLWWRYEMGIEKCPFSSHDHTINVEYSNSKWLTDIFTFLQKFQITIHIKLQWPNMYEEKDRYLMDIGQEQKLPTKSLQLINQCRLFLRVLTLSDITNPTGTQLT